MTQSLHQQVKSSIEQSLRKAQTPGAVIAVRVNGESFLEMGVGYQDLNHDALIASDARFYIYSVTKSLIAIAALDLVSQGILDLNTAIQSYLPELAIHSAINLRHLLSHTSGFPDYGGMSAYFDAVKATPTVPWSRETFLNLALDSDLQFAPGTDWAYSNLGYVVLRCLLERVTHLSLQELLHQIIFRPLSLHNTFVSDTLDDVVALTPGYTAFFDDSELQNMAVLYHPGWVSHGVVISTAPELAKIIEALFLNQILSADVVEQMRSPVHVLGKYPLFEKLAYGLGLFINLNSPNGTVVGHTGEGLGYSVAAFHFPNLAGAQTTIAAFTNRDKSDHGLVLVYKIAEILKRSLHL